MNTENSMNTKNDSYPRPTFEQIRALVVQWFRDRRIVPNSTAAAQTLKAVSEMGELADAVLKGERGKIVDGVGDVRWVIRERDEALANAARGDVAKALLAQIENALNAAGVPTLHPDIGAVERKPMLIRERVEWLENEWSEARFQVQRLKAELRTAEGEWKHWKRIADHRKEKSSAMEARPEPSRLEIAADLLCAWEGRAEITNVDTACKDALSIADTLIAAAKEQ